MPFLVLSIYRRDKTNPSLQRISLSSEGPGFANRCWASSLPTRDTAEGRVGDGSNGNP